MAHEVDENAARKRTLEIENGRPVDAETDDEDDETDDSE